MLKTAELVRRIRERTGDTQEALARRLDVSFPTVNSWERGRTSPRPIHRRKLEQLADEVGVAHGLTVLVIDDDPATGELVAAAAAGVDAAISVETADDGWEGLIKLGSMHPGMLFLDILMPGIDGIEVARRIPSIEGLDDMLIVFVTSSRSEPILDSARALGHKLVLKPLDIDVLTASMKELLERDPSPSPRR